LEIDCVPALIEKVSESFSTKAEFPPTS